MFPSGVTFTVRTRPSVNDTLEVFRITGLLRGMSPLLGPLGSVISFQINVRGLGQSSRRFVFVNRGLSLKTLMSFGAFGYLDSLGVPLGVNLGVELKTVRVFLIALSRHIFHVSLSFNGVRQLVLVSLSRRSRSASVCIPLHKTTGCCFARTGPAISVGLAAISLFA